MRVQLNRVTCSLAHTYTGCASPARCPRTRAGIATGSKPTAAAPRTTSTGPPLHPPFILPTAQQPLFLNHRACCSVRVELGRHVDLTGKTFHELASALYSANKMVALGFKEDNHIRINPGDPTNTCQTLLECGCGCRVHPSSWRRFLVAAQVHINTTISSHTNACQAPAAESRSPVLAVMTWQARTTASAAPRRWCSSCWPSPSQHSTGPSKTSTSPYAHPR